MFPRGRYDDLTDAVGQGLWFLREAGVLRMDEEVTAEQNERLRPRSPPARLYPC
jgi:hypothetical protein